MSYRKWFSSAEGGAVVWMSLKGKHTILIAATAEAVSYHILDADIHKCQLNYFQYMSNIHKPHKP